MATATKSKAMFSTRNDLSREVRGRMIELLNQQLADTFDLYSQTSRRIGSQGTQFFQLHELFDKLAEDCKATWTNRRTHDGAGRPRTGTVGMTAANSSCRNSD